MTMRNEEGLRMSDDHIAERHIVNFELVRREPTGWFLAVSCHGELEIVAELDSHTIPLDVVLSGVVVRLRRALFQ
jgi:hypothetical protein